MLFAIKNIHTKEYYCESGGWNKDVGKARTFKQKGHVKLFLHHNKRWFNLDDLMTVSFNLVVADEQDQEDVIKEVMNKRLLDELERGN